MSVQSKTHVQPVDTQVYVHLEEYSEEDDCLQRTSDVFERSRSESYSTDESDEERQQIIFENYQFMRNNPCIAEDEWAFEKAYDACFDLKAHHAFLGKPGCDARLISEEDKRFLLKRYEWFRTHYPTQESRDAYKREFSEESLSSSQPDSSEEASSFSSEESQTFMENERIINLRFFHELIDEDEGAFQIVRKHFVIAELTPSERLRISKIFNAFKSEYTTEEAKSAHRIRQILAKKELFS
jgi:hypothetical protein